MTSATSPWTALAASEPARMVQRQLQAADVPQAWLFAGARGGGKAMAARAVASALQCELSPREGCGGCSSCTRIARGSHPDVHHIEPEGPLIPVDLIREVVLPQAARSPFEGRYKIFVIHEAHRMNDAAQNALLKTLEEPLPDTVFLLISDNEDELLETIRSRCRVVRFATLALGSVKAVLQDRGVDPARAETAARVAGGDLERALELSLDDQAWARRRSWLAIPRRLESSVAAMDVVAEVLDEVKVALKGRERAQKSEVKELDDALGGARGTAGARNALLARHRRELRRVEEDLVIEVLQTLASFYRDVLVLRNADLDEVVNLDVVEELKTWVDAPVANGAVVHAADRCARAELTIPRNANRQLALESVFLDLVALRQDIPASV